MREYRFNYTNGKIVPVILITWAVGFLLCAAFWIGVAVVVHHFIVKYW